MSGLIGKKVGMTQLFDHSGKVIPVTVIAAGPCYVTQIKTKADDGYEAVQLGFAEVSEKHSTKPRQGHCKKARVKTLRFLREFEKSADREVKVGDELKVDIFAVGDKIVITGRSKGKGFQGWLNAIIQRRQHLTVSLMATGTGFWDRFTCVRVYKKLKWQAEWVTTR
jgi:large subunit ribosomal protein L3